jgi:very-short-patch-repair endonuclease
MPWRAKPGSWQVEKPLARAMRREPTAAERAMWERLRHRQVAGMRFLRQRVIDRFIVDFFCSEHRLVIEVDGEVHRNRVERDSERTRALEMLGLTVLRFDNAEVLDDIDTVIQRVAERATRRDR